MLYPVFQHPFTCIIAAPSGSGKSSLAFRIIKNSKALVRNTDNQGFDSIFVVYRSPQPLYQQMKNELTVPVFFFENCLPSNIANLLANFNTPLILIDDGISKENEEQVVQLFCRLSHHLNVSVILIGQTLFDSKSQALRVCHRNCHVLFIFDSPRDQRSLQILVHQMIPESKKAKALLQSIQSEFSQPYAYFMFDFQKCCHPDQRFKTNIFCENGGSPFAHVYKSKNTFQLS